MRYFILSVMTVLLTAGLTAHSAQATEQFLNIDNATSEDLSHAPLSLPVTTLKSRAISSSSAWRRASSTTTKRPSSEIA